MKWKSNKSRPAPSIAWANDYFNARLYADAWNNASETDREKSLTQASFLIAGAFEFYESAYSIDARGAIHWNERALAAVCEEALWLLKRDPTHFPELLGAGISQASASSLSATFDRKALAPLICDAAKNLIGRLGAFEGVEDEPRSCKSTPLAT